MDCLAEPDRRLRAMPGGSPFNLARAAARQGADVHWHTPFSQDVFGGELRRLAASDGLHECAPASPRPTSLAIVTLHDGAADYAFHRSEVADRDWQPEAVLARLGAAHPGVLHTGSLMLVPPQEGATIALLQAACRQGWTISLDLNIRPRLAGDLDGYRRAVRQALPLADWLKASDEDLAFMGYGDSADNDVERLRAAWSLPHLSRVAITHGADGACLWVDGARAQAPAHPVQLIDTVGAGDTFWGTCLADWTLDPTDAATRVEHTLHRALRAAALNCAREGCQPPTAAELAA